MDNIMIGFAEVKDDELVYEMKMTKEEAIAESLKIMKWDMIQRAGEQAERNHLVKVDHWYGRVFTKGNDFVVKVYGGTPVPKPEKVERKKKLTDINCEAEELAHTEVEEEEEEGVLV